MEVLLFVPVLEIIYVVTHVFNVYSQPLIALQSSVYPDQKHTEYRFQILLTQELIVIE